MNADGVILQCNNLRVNYGKIEVLQGVSLAVKYGEVIGILGPNGAGKTTLVKAIAGLKECSSGEIKHKDMEITNLRPHQIVETGITLVPERRRVFPDMTVLENLEMGAFLVKDKDELTKRFAYTFQKLPKLKHRLSQLASTLSGGEQQMLAIGRGLMAKPSLLILDEPSLGLAPIIVNEVFQTVKELSAEMTILLVEQNVRASLNVCNRVFILNNGQIVHEDTAKNILEREDLFKLYVGLT